MRKPLVSIITVCYNAQDVIESTINSVRIQDYENIEYIVVDGNSSDDTKIIIEQNRDAITKFISEPDNGLYYAMNKGLDMATGEYVWFINAGDRIAHSNTLSKIMSSSLILQDIYYGKTKIINKQGQVIGERRLTPPARLNRNSFKMGMLVCHQAIIIKKKLTTHYNTKYSITSDYDWVQSAIEKASPEKIRNTHLTFCKFLEGGISSKRMNKANMERFHIMIEHFGLFQALFFNFIMSFRFIKSKIKGEL